MKKLIVLAVTFLILQGCDTHPFTKGYFAMVNNSGKDVVISSYYVHVDHTATLSRKFPITNNGKYEMSLLYFSEDLPFTFQKDVGGDSISIDFGDKVQGYRNSIYNVKSPYYLGSLNKSNDFIYTLTPEDYTNATPKP